MNNVKPIYSVAADAHSFTAFTIPMAKDKQGLNTINSVSAFSQKNKRKGRKIDVNGTIPPLEKKVILQARIQGA